MDIENSNLLIIASKYYFDPLEMKNVWVIEKIGRYCDNPSKYKNRIEHFLEQLYEASEMMVLWYGGDYVDLDIIETKEDLINLVKDNLMSTPVELYILGKNKKKI